ncbi:MAG: FAD-linked oxidase C-terminal domain-containing protein [Opitutaceae bacterium]
MFSRTSSADLPVDLRRSLARLRRELDGELCWDETMRVCYATDASVYRQKPMAVALPRNRADVRRLLEFARRQRVPLVPRTAGTSLAGQVVGAGLVVDFGRYMNRILEIDPARRRVRVEPGVVRDELNLALRPHGLMFAPETSTSNRAMIGGMVGNNSCGSNSLRFGSTRDHLLEAEVLLADGSETVLRALSTEEFSARCAAGGLQGDIHRWLARRLAEPETASEIVREFPEPTLRRRNTGYAVDLLLRQRPFAADGAPFNLCALLAGSEGTLALATELTLNLVPLPPAERGVLVVHLGTVHEATRANLIALRHAPDALELIDRIILDCASRNREQARNRVFVQGDPGALLVIEWARGTRAEVETAAAALEAELRGAGFGYAFPRLFGADVARVWALRKAGLGVLANIPGDAKAVACVEDTAVPVAVQPAYLEEFEAIMRRHGMDCVFYAHIGDGEIHTRPVLDLKRGPDRAKFQALTVEVAALVKRYRGSLSGEHGDGRVRGPFLRNMVGERNYALLSELKIVFDPAGVLNPGKIVAARPMTEALRYEPEQATRPFVTALDFSQWGGVLRLAEQCNGTADCRKTIGMGGGMCPSFMATRDERHSTRARANVLREALTRSGAANPFAEPSVGAAMELCLSCKACKSECPSSVDVALLKAEWLHQRRRTAGVSLRSRVFGQFTPLARAAALWPAAANWVARSPLTAPLLKRALGVAPARALPLFARETFRAWLRRNPKALAPAAGVARRGRVHLFVDEFTDNQEPELARAAVELCTVLGYEIVVADCGESGRSSISKGLLPEAREAARRNVAALHGRVSEAEPLLGLEPSALLGFRDEYPLLVGAELRPQAEALAPHCLLFEEWIAREARAGRIDADDFGAAPAEILVHGHCHQKALSRFEDAVAALSLPRGHTVRTVAAGCCGMAGAFGYEREHYALSLQIGELALLPAVRATAAEVLIVAAGTSCRAQIEHGTGRRALHPVQVLRRALPVR